MNEPPPASLPSPADSVCILIPTFNNGGTLASVLDECLMYGKQILVVNDGSTDHTADILQGYPQITAINLSQNQGKGAALLTGFAAALKAGFAYAITLDSDGQHLPADLPVFFEALTTDPGSMVIGARNMNQDAVPTRSSFGNKFSNFWFWVETGIRLPDTQSGYRLYPLLPLANLHFFSRKYEFEIEAPVRLAWQGVSVKSVPIRVYYPPAATRISHFRPFRDTLRISLLNTLLTLTALFWIHPRNLVNKLTRKEGRRKIWLEVFKAPHESNLVKASSLGFGVFMGIFPIWGFQLAIGIPLAIYFKLNKPLFILAANISIFPLTPVIWAISLLCGKVILQQDWHFSLRSMTLQEFKQAGLAFFMGGSVLAIAAGLLTFLLSWLILQKFRTTPRP